MKVSLAVRAAPPLAEVKGAAIIGGIVAMAAASGFAVTRVTASRDVLVLVAIGAILLSPIAFRLVQGRFDPFEPIVTFAVAFGVMFVIRPMAMLAEGNFVYSGFPVRDTFSEMTVLAAAGAAAFIGAYALPLGRRIAADRNVPRSSFHSDRILVGALCTAALGVVLIGLFLARAGISLDLILAGRSARLTDAYRSSSAYLAQGPYLLASSALMLFVAGRAYARKGFMMLAAIIAIIVLFLSVPTGSRMLLLPFIGGALVYRYVSKNARPRIVTAIGLVAVSLFVSTVLHNARLAGDGPRGGLRASASSTLRHPEQVFNPLTTGLDAAMAPGLATALRVVPEDLEFMRGRASVGDLVTRPIPRQLWSEKPLAPRETIILRLWPEEYVHRVANPEFSVLLYFYLDFAIFGVIVGMAAYGVIARSVYEYFRAHDDNLVVRLVYSVSVPFVVIALRDSPVDTFARGVFILLPILLVFRFAAERTPRTVDV